MRGCLDGIRVIDMTAVVAGPLASHMLAEHGAEVIKVESLAGDVGRYLGGRGRHAGMGPKFMHLNENKRSIAIDLKSPEGHEIIRGLLATADVFLSNLRVKSVRALGLSYDEVRKIKDDIVYCQMVGFGSHGRYKDRPAYDSIIQGMAGVVDLNARGNGVAAYVPYVVADRTAGIIAGSLINMALFHHARTGQGQYIEVPMFENMAVQVLEEHMYSKTFIPDDGRMGDPRILALGKRPTKTSDGFLCITANTDAQAFALFDVIGRPELKDDPRFCDVAARFRNADEYFRIREEVFATEPSDHWMSRLLQRGVPVAEVRPIDDLLADEHLRDVGMFVEREHPTEGRLYELKDPNLMSAEAGVDWRGAPRLGEDTASVLEGLGLTAGEIEQLRLRRIIAGPADPQQRNAR
ncbi:Crotonobetainyl-CoA:carnitine CoA-transferase CaiB-like acyl-CoA transferase OS=Castellaniella defragrans OX=75697 GN=HNR28_003406 PE=3 SV=1 [Castellaniella defragrans]